MNEIQRFVVPALLAFLVHGALANFTIHKNSISAPKLTGIPISININSSFPDPSPEDQQVNEKKEVTSNSLPPEVIEKKEVTPNSLLPEVIEKKEIASKLLPPEAIVKQTKRRSIPTIEPLGMKKIIKSQEVKQISEHQNEVERKSKEELLPPEVNNYERNQNVKPREVIDESAVEELREEENLSVLVHKKAIPVYQQNKQPPYPVMAKRRGYQGEVTLSVLVDSQGIVSGVKIKTTSGHGSLDKAALAAVRRWRFIPATIDGKPVDMWVDVPIDFRLQ